MRIVMKTPEKPVIQKQKDKKLKKEEQVKQQQIEETKPIKKPTFKKEKQEK